jgi:transmembrane sensor
MSKLNLINDEIKELITRYLTGDIDRKQLELLKKWMNESEENNELFNTFKSSWILSGIPNTKDQFTDNNSWGNIQAKLGFDREDQDDEAEDRKIALFNKLRTAAIWLLFFGLGSLMTYFISSNKIAQNYNTEITVPFGTKSIAKLPDGSTVYLNAGSTITYNQDFNKTKRLVYLSGEAFFKVATNKKKPFEVITPFVIVRATGTKFNVKAYPSEGTITATLVEGKIDIRKTNDLKDKSGIELKPKQCFVYFKTDQLANSASTSITSNKQPAEKINKVPGNFRVLDNVKTELYTSWSEENWVFESESLRTFVPKIERRFNMVIRFENEEIKDYKFTGTIQRETIEQILQALKTSTPMINYKITKDTISLGLNRKTNQ